MNDTDKQPSFWSKPITRWTVTVLLGVIFIVALIVFLAADLVSRDLLNPDLYTIVLEEEDIYNRIYTELLADPAMVEATGLILGNMNMDPRLADRFLSFTTSTLYLVIPPDTIQSGVEGTINAVTAYFRGDTDELQPEIVIAELDQNVMADRILNSLMALTGELIAEALPETGSVPTEVDLEALAQYMAEFGGGNIGPIPANVSGASLENISPDQRGALVDLLLGPAAETVSSNTRLQVDAALRANDLPGAIALSSRERLRIQVEEAAAELIDIVRNSEALNAVTSAAGILGQTTAELIDGLNNIRSVMIFLDRVAIPLTLVAMVFSLGAVVWIHADNLTKMLRTTGVMLIATGFVVSLVWLIFGLVLRDSLAARFAAGSDLPASLESMITDVVTNLSSTVWGDVWRTATVPFVLGLALLILSFIPRLPALVDRVLKPVAGQRKIIIVGGVLAIFLVPIGLRLLIQENRQPELVCNGNAALCDRPVNEIVFAATHNSMSIADYGWIWPSHDGSITNQLNAGVRAFLIDTHYWDDQAWIESQLQEMPEELQTAVQDILDVVELSQEDGVYLCHMMCGLGATALTDTLEEMRSFLDNHPDEVIVLIIEDLISTADTDQAFAESGLDALVYTYEPGAPWPTLEEMIKSNRRVLVMAEDAGPPPDWYLHAWDYTEETPFSFSKVADIDEDSCVPNRGDTDKPFFLLNHWVTRASPSRVDAAVLNDYDFLLDRALKCAEERGQIPNFVGVNFYLNGDLFEVVDELNGVRQAAEE